MVEDVSDPRRTVPGYLLDEAGMLEAGLELEEAEASDEDDDEAYLVRNADGSITLTNP
jgi:hypothetical protein